MIPNNPGNRAKRFGDLHPRVYAALIGSRYGL
jgi:hypothetical protein